MYGSTMSALENLYPRLALGGFLIVDDYHLSGCRKAVDDFRRANAMGEEIIPIDGWSVYWRKRT
jgi:O-methyltransferase